MMRIRTAVLVAGCMIGAAFRADAHHSFSAEFDRDKPITLTGAVAKIEWTNPHARIYIDVEDENGNLESWDFELGPPNGLMRLGWRPSSLREGQIVTIEGFLSKREERVANARSVRLPDGRRVFAGSSFDTTSASE